MMPLLAARGPAGCIDARDGGNAARAGRTRPPGRTTGPTIFPAGQQQRVAIARALAMSPALVLADEPTGNLDTQSADGVFDLLRSVNEELETTFLIVTHDPRLASRCDRIIELVDGRIVADRANPNPVRHGAGRDERIDSPS